MVRCIIVAEWADDQLETALGRLEAARDEPADDELCVDVVRELADDESVAGALGGPWVVVVAEEADESVTLHLAEGDIDVRRGCRGRGWRRGLRWRQGRGDRGCSGGLRRSCTGGRRRVLVAGSDEREEEQCGE